MKYYTTKDQSRIFMDCGIGKETADMYYDGDDVVMGECGEHFPCWSFGALIDAITTSCEFFEHMHSFNISKQTKDTYLCQCDAKNGSIYVEGSENPINAIGLVFLQLKRDCVL